MIARADGQVILVAGAIPGERARISIERVAKGVAYGAVDEVEERSPDRREPHSDPLCGGALYAYISYPRQLTLKAEIVADALARIGRVTWTPAIEVAASPEDGYRMRARLHLRDGRAGFFREGSHQTCSARQTGQLLPATSDVVEEIASRLATSATGSSAEIEVSENVDASERAVHLETTPPLARSALAELGGIAGLTGLTASQPVAGDQAVTVVSGDPFVHDVLAFQNTEVVLRRHVIAFFQGNRFLIRPLVEHVLAHIPDGADLVDLYAGVGLFAVAAAAVRGAQVTAVEGDRVAAADLAANAKRAGDLMTAVHQSVERFVGGHRAPPGVVLIDPPRTGLSKEALDGVIRLQPRRLIYVSCDVATLARDLRRLVESGYELRDLSAFDLFPTTPHVETVAVLARG